MPTAKKREPAKKAKAKSQKRPAKKKESAAARMSREVIDMMQDVKCATKSLRLRLARFKRLRPETQAVIYDYIDIIARQFDDIIDDYWNALPEESKEQETPDSLFPPLPPPPPPVARMMAHLLGFPVYQDPEWPEVIEIEPEPPKEEGD